MSTIRRASPRLVTGWVVRSRQCTGSPSAARLLEGWEERVGEFTKVMPRDYRRALEMKVQEETAEWRAAMGVQAAS